MDAVTRYQIRQKIKEQILLEHLGPKPTKLLVESGAVLSEDMGNFLATVAGKALGGGEGSLGSKAAAFLPDAAVKSVKKYLVSHLFKSLGIPQGSALAEFIENLIVYIPIGDISRIVSGNITCEEVNDILLGATSQTITHLGLKKVLPPLVHYFSQYEISADFGSGKPLVKRKKGGKDLKSVTIKQVETMLDTMIGVMGETMVSKLVFNFAKSLNVGIGDEICAMVGIKSSAIQQDTSAAVDIKSDLGSGAFNQPAQGQTIIDMTTPPKLGDSTTKLTTAD